MQNVDLLINARWVLPIAPENCVLPNHSVAIQQDRIVNILPTEQAKQQYQAKQTLNRPDHALMPGFVNAHAHTPMNLFRGLADDLALMDWLQNHIWPAEQAIINEQSVADGSRLAIAEMIRGGTTCFNDHYFFPNSTGQVAIECGMRASLGCVIMSVPTDWAKTEAEYFDKAKHVLKDGVKHPLITWTVAPHAPYTVDDSSLEKIKQLAEEYNLQIHMHMQETQFEVDESLKQYQMRPLQRMHKLGLLSSRFIAVHMVALNDEDIALTQETGTHVIHCPESNLKLASGFAPITGLLKAGINVGIGTDGAASNNDLDMMGEMRTAAMTAKAVAGDPTAVNAETALKMATLNSAKALGLDKDIGSIEKNKAADLITVDLSSYLTQPTYNPMSQIVYAANRMQVADVWVAGKQLLSNGEFTQMDIANTVKQAKKWQAKADAFKSAASETKTKASI